MCAGHDVLARAEQQEGTSAVRALGLALPEALVADERALLVADQSTDLDALERAVRDLAVDLGGRSDLGEDRPPDLEEVEHDRVPLERAQVHEQGTGCVRHLRDVQAASEAVDDPRLDRAEEQVVLLVRLPDVLMVVNHPPQLDGREVCGELQTRSVKRVWSDD